MKKFNYKFWPLLVLGIALTFTSCKEDDESEAPAPTRSELLTSRNWKMTMYNVEPALDWDGDGTQENNLIPYVGACTLDDFWNFIANGSYTLEEGASKCDPNDPQIIESGTWLWSSDQTQLIMNANAQTFEATVVSLSSSQLVIEFTVVNAGVTYTFTQTMI